MDISEYIKNNYPEIKLTIENIKTKLLETNKSIIAIFSDSPSNNTKKRSLGCLEISCKDDNLIGKLLKIHEDYDYNKMTNNKIILRGYTEKDNENLRDFFSNSDDNGNNYISYVDLENVKENTDDLLDQQNTKYLYVFFDTHTNNFSILTREYSNKIESIKLKHTKWKKKINQSQEKLLVIYNDLNQKIKDYEKHILDQLKMSTNHPDKQKDKTEYESIVEELRQDRKNILSKIQDIYRLQKSQVKCYKNSDPRLNKSRENLLQTETEKLNKLETVIIEIQKQFSHLDTSLDIDNIRFKQLSEELLHEDKMTKKLNYIKQIYRDFENDYKDNKISSTKAFLSQDILSKYNSINYTISINEDYYKHLGTELQDHDIIKIKRNVGDLKKESDFIAKNLYIRLKTSDIQEDTDKKQEIINSNFEIKKQLSEWEYIHSDKIQTVKKLIEQCKNFDVGNIGDYKLYKNTNNKIKLEYFDEDSDREDNSNTKINITLCLDVINKYININNWFYTVSKTIDILISIISDWRSKISMFGQIPTGKIIDKIANIKSLMNEHLRILDIETINSHGEFHKLKSGDPSTDINYDFYEYIVSCLEFFYINKELYLQSVIEIDEIIKDLQRDSELFIRINYKPGIFDNGIIKIVNKQDIEEKQRDIGKYIILGNIEEETKNTGQEDDYYDNELKYGPYSHIFSSIHTSEDIYNISNTTNSQNKEIDNTNSKNIKNFFKKLEIGYTINIFDIVDFTGKQYKSTIFGDQENTGIIYLGLFDLQDVKKITVSEIWYHYNSIDKHTDTESSLVIKNVLNGDLENNIFLNEYLQEINSENSYYDIDNKNGIRIRNKQELQSLIDYTNDYCKNMNMESGFNIFIKINIKFTNGIKSTLNVGRIIYNENEETNYFYKFLKNDYKHKTLKKETKIQPDNYSDYVIKNINKNTNTDKESHTNTDTNKDTNKDTKKDTNKNYNIFLDFAIKFIEHDSHEYSLRKNKEKFSIINKNSVNPSRTITINNISGKIEEYTRTKIKLKQIQKLI